MRIKELIIDGFKSYANRVSITDWDSQFNAITGLNGSGKSNILDSICFVLGISQLKQVRANNLQELVYKQGQSRVTKASVTIVFDNTDKKGSPVGYEQFNEITVSRQVVIGGRNKYMINGHTAQQNRVKNLFHSVQLNVNNPHFLIMQGRITKVINMKPPEILSMIEEAAGTRMYETGKQSAMRTILKKQTKVTEINKILTEDITPSLEKLRKERSSYIQWTSNNQEIERLDRQVIAFTYQESEKTSNQSKDDVKDMQDQHTELEEENVQAKKDIHQIEKKVTDLTREKEQQMEGSFKVLEKRVTEVSKELVKHTSVWEHKTQEIKGEQKSLKEIESSTKKLKSAITKKTKEQETLKKAVAAIEMKQKEVKEKVSSLQGQQIGITMSDSKEEQGSLTNQLMEKQKSASEMEAKMAHFKKKMSILKKDVAAKTKSAKSQEKEFANLKKVFNKAIAKEKKIDAELANSSFNPERIRSLTKSVADLQQALNLKNEKRESLSAEVSRFNFEYNIQNRSFDHSKVKGLVAKLIRIKDPKTTTAIEVTAGSKLFQVVVDNQQTGKLLLEKGKLKRRVTIIPLNKIASRSIDSKVVNAAQKLVGKDNANLALSLVGYDEELDAAMRYVFGRTIICTDSNCAKKITFNENIRKRSVTLDGDVYDPQGTLTGGSSMRKVSVLSQLQKLNAVDTDIKNLQARLNTLQKELDGLKNTAERAKELQCQKELVMHEVKLNQAKLDDSSYSQTKAEADNMQSELKGCMEECTRMANEHKQVKQRCSELEASIKDFENQKKKKQQEVVRELKKAKKLLVAMTSQLKAEEQKLDKVNMELQALEDEENGLLAQQEKLQKQIEDMQKEESALAAMVSNAKEAYMGKNQELEAKRESLAECDKEIGQLIKRKKAIEKQISDRELQAKKLAHKIARMVTDAKDAKKRVEVMKRKYPWIEQEQHLFGQPHTDYDFKKHNPKAAKTRLEKLKKKQSDLSKKLNKKVMGMFERAEQEYQELLKKRDQIQKDKHKIEQVIEELDLKKNEALETTWKKVNKDFGSIFSACLPGTSAKLSPQEGKSVLDGLEVKVAFSGIWKQSLTELSGGQRSLLALSLILALLRFKPAPMYILDEVDAALDLSHTQNIGQMLKKHFPQSQFIVVSLKEGMFNNANTIFRTKFVDGVSTVKTVKGAGVSKRMDKENISKQTRRVGKSKRLHMR